MRLLQDRRSLQARGRRRATSVLYEAQSIAAEYPALALPLARLRGRGVPVDSSADIVIEGFPRSANSFAVAAFSRAQGRRARIAHHVHAPAQVLAAVRMNIPALVLLREPEDAVLEYVLKKPAITVGQALRGYARFYGPLLRVRGRFVVGRFDRVTTDFGAVIREVNERFGTSFAEFEHTAENERSVLDEIDAYWRSILPPGEQLELTVGRPSSVRDEMKEELREAYRSPALAPARTRASTLYERLGS